MTKASLIDDFYNDEIIVNYEKENTRKEKIDFYSQKRNIRSNTHVREKIGFRFKKVLGVKQIKYTEELSDDENINNPILPLENSQSISVPMYGIADEKPSVDLSHLSKDAKEKIVRYKNLLENASINDTMKNNPVETVVDNVGVDLFNTNIFTADVNEALEHKAKKGFGFFSGIKGIFGFKK